VRRRIVVLGATGRTGRLVADELAGVGSVLLAGRDEVALAEVGERTGLPTALVDVTHPGVLAAVLHPGDVLLSLVGPYDLLGDAVVAAAIDANATYVDVAGEPAFLDRVYGVHGPAAALRGVALLPAAGLECLPGHLVAHEALLAVGDDAASVQVAYLTEGGLDSGGAAGRRSLVRAMSHPTTTYHRARLRQEHVGARRSSITAAGRRHHTLSIGGAEVWTLPAHHRSLVSVDVHTGWFGPLGPAVSLSTRFAWPFRAVGADRVVDQALRVIGDGPAGALDEGLSRVVARVRAADGTTVAGREAIGGNPVVLAARLAAAAADRLALADVRDLPTGATDPIAVFGREGLAELCSWAGVVVV
jgi:hypothetical protein